jgi:polyphosphate kinase
MKYIYQLADDMSGEKISSLSYRPYQSKWPEDISKEHRIIEQIQKQNKLLFYPYDSVEPFLRLLSEAAERPDVTSTKIATYRLASSSKTAHICAVQPKTAKRSLSLWI